MKDLIHQASEDLARSTNAVALTGAGISVESGIPPFRGKGGLWERFDPMEYAHIDAFMKNPAKVWVVLIKEMKGIMDYARPNDAHNGLAGLEKLGILKTIITQNVDGLHQMAGNTDVIEFHGNFAWQRCMECNNRCMPFRGKRRRLDTRLLMGGTHPWHPSSGASYDAGGRGGRIELLDALILMGGWCGLRSTLTRTRVRPRRKIEGWLLIMPPRDKAMESAESCCAPSSRSLSRDEKTRSESRTSLTGPSHPGPDKVCLLDTRLLMGGTYHLE